MAGQHVARRPVPPADPTAQKAMPAVPAATSELRALVERIRALPGVRGKAAIGLVSEVFGRSDFVAGPGDDGAVVVDEGRNLVVGGEALLPAFVERHPRGAGIAAVVANVNDLAAMGARPLALVDTVVGPRPHLVEMLEGLRWAADLYQVPVVGGHLTETDGPPSLSAFGLGRAEAVLSATRAAPGQALLLVACLEGTMRPDFLFFRSFDERGDALAGDVRTFAVAAEAGLAVAAKDVSMAGLVGSLAMLLEPTRTGVEVDLRTLPVPAGVAPADWLCCFPAFAFLVTTAADRADACAALFQERGLTAARLGTLDASGTVRLRDASGAAAVFDLTREGITRLAAAP